MIHKPAPSLERALHLARTTKAFSYRRDGRGRVLYTYLYASPEVFQEEGARELRGIVYDERDGRILSRPFHKFFNYREPPYGLGPEDFSGQEIYLAPKVDGYLLQVYLWEGELQFSSRHSLEPPLVGKLVQKVWTEEHGALAKRILEKEPLTLLYEVVDPDQPLMVKYERSGLHFIAARRIETGEYLLPGIHLDWPQDHIVWESVERFDPEAFFQDIKERRGEEGYVAYLPGLGEFVKFKTRWAFRLASFLKDPGGTFVQAYISDTLDDLLSALSEREDLTTQVLAAERYLNELYREVVDFGTGCAQYGLERKEAWEKSNEAFGDRGPLSKILVSVAMEAYGGGNPRRTFYIGLSRIRSKDFLGDLIQGGEGDA